MRIKSKEIQTRPFLANMDSTCFGEDNFSELFSSDSVTSFNKNNIYLGLYTAFHLRI